MNEQQVQQTRRTTVIYHSADFDGLFCREIARKFLGDAGVDYIGWDFADAALPIPPEGNIYVLDLPVDRIFGLKFDLNGTMDGLPTEGSLGWLSQVIWIDHHKSSIETHPAMLPGYRIDGVSACRLAWQFFLAGKHIGGGLAGSNEDLPDTVDFVTRTVEEPYAVRLAGEYDIWDKRDENADVFQYGLRASEITAEEWRAFLSADRLPRFEEAQIIKMGGFQLNPNGTIHPMEVQARLHVGKVLQTYQQGIDASVVKHRSMVIFWEGLRWLALNTARCNSLSFAALDVPETGHDALMGFYFKDGFWNVSLYHARHKTELDLSQIATRYGGGGHRGACGFRSETAPWIS